MSGLKAEKKDYPTVGFDPITTVANCTQGRKLTTSAMSQPGLTTI